MQSVEEQHKRTEQEGKCGFCEAGNAKIECKTCEVFYCDSCSANLHSKPQFKKHQLSPIYLQASEADDAQKSFINWNKYCNDHKDQKLSLYCTEDFKPVCPHCLLIGRCPGQNCS